MLGIKVFKIVGSRQRGGGVISQNENAFDEIILSKVEETILGNINPWVMCDVEIYTL